MQVVRAIALGHSIRRIFKWSTVIVSMTVLFFFAGCHFGLRWCGRRSRSRTFHSARSVGDSRCLEGWLSNSPFGRNRKSRPDTSVRLVVKTVDGDGISIQYKNDSWTTKLAAGERTSVSVYAKHGRNNRPISIELYANQEPSPVVTPRAYRRGAGQSLPAEHPWIVGLGSSRCG